MLDKNTEVSGWRGYSKRMLDLKSQREAIERIKASKLPAQNKPNGAAQ